MGLPGPCELVFVWTVAVPAESLVLIEGTTPVAIRWGAVLTRYLVAGRRRLPEVPRSAVIVGGRKHQE
jgi:hypothetical protein